MLVGRLIPNPDGSFGATYAIESKPVSVESVSAYPEMTFDTELEAMAWLQSEAARMKMDLRLEPPD